MIKANFPCWKCGGELIEYNNILTCLKCNPPPKRKTALDELDAELLRMLKEQCPELNEHIEFGRKPQKLPDNMYLRSKRNGDT